MMFSARFVTPWVLTSLKVGSTDESIIPLEKIQLNLMKNCTCNKTDLDDPMMFSAIIGCCMALDPLEV